MDHRGRCQLWWVLCVLLGCAAWAQRPETVLDRADQPLPPPYHGFVVDDAGNGLVRADSVWRWSADRRAQLWRDILTRCEVRSKAPLDPIAVIENSPVVPDDLRRSARFGMFLGSLSFTGSRAAGLNETGSWILGGTGTLLGLAGGHVFDIDWPPAFTARAGGGPGFTMTLGWQRRPAWLPRPQALNFGPRRDGPFTVGLSLGYNLAPSNDAGVSVFLDPFAFESDAYGGFQAGLTF